MEWKVINKRTQQDKVGNLLQVDGGVVPKKCKSCKSDLESKITLKEKCNAHQNVDEFFVDFYLVFTFIGVSKIRTLFGLSKFFSHYLQLIVHLE